MKILITGGNGFIGKHVVQSLLKENYSVSVFDRKLKMVSNELQNKIEFVYGSITDPVAVYEAMSEVDGFVHLAGVLGTQETIKKPMPAIQTNLFGGLNILEAAAHYSVPGVNITVGNWWMDNTYSITKNMTERFVKMYNKERNTEISNVRIVNTYGPGQSVAAPFGNSSVRKIMPSFICRALTGRDIEIYGDGAQISDIVYVSDVAKIIMLELRSVMSRGAKEYCLEIGSKNPLTVLDTAKYVRDIACDLGYSKVNIKHLSMRPGENSISLLSHEGERSLSATVNELISNEYHSELLSFATKSMIRKLRNVVAADISTLNHLDIDVEKFTPPQTGIRNTIEYYIKTQGGVWNDYE